MGCCISKNKKPTCPSPTQIPSNDLPCKEEKKKEIATQQVAEEATEKKQVFVITQNKKQPTITTTPEEKEKEKKKGELPKKKTQLDGDGNGVGNIVVVVEQHRPATVRTSSCTKEEVDAILIQCGRLSRSSSGKTSNDNTNGSRKYSGSKRSYDFDEEKRREDDEEWEKPLSRPSPHRRTPSRERDGGECKRSGSRERGSGGGRRVSRSPGRRSDGPASSSSASASDKSRPVGKMVSVPAREKGGVAPETGGASVKRISSVAVGNKRGGEIGGVRTASPRSRSPANTARGSSENAQNHQQHAPQPQSLSRSSSRKAEHSPYRRNPLGEMDENLIRSEQPLSKNQNSSNNNKVQRNKEGEDVARKPSQSQSQKTRTAEISNGNNSNSTMSKGVREQLMSCRAKETQPEPEIVEEVVEAKGPSKGAEVPLMNIVMESLDPRTITRTRSSRRSSRDFDHSLGLNPDTLLNPTSYNSKLLEDIQNYHHQNTAFSLPACVSKACSILEAVADLNSSFSDNKSYEGDQSNNDHGPLLDGHFRKRGLVVKEPFVESEIVVKDDLMEPSLHKYVSVRDLGGEMEPQESAGSNSFIGQPWTSSWEPNSVDSTDRCWNSQSSNIGEEEEELSPIAHRIDARGRRLKGGSSSNSLPTGTPSGSKKRELDRGLVHRGSSGGSGKVTGRAFGLPVAAAASS